MSLRREPRFKWATPVRVTWLDDRGSMRFARGTTIDISEGGARLEVSEAVPKNSTVGFQADALKVTASARVKHCTRSGVKFRVGLEFFAAVRLDPALIQPSLSSSASPVGAP